MVGKASSGTPWITRVGARQRLAAAVTVAVSALAVQPHAISLPMRLVASWDAGLLAYLVLAWWLIARLDPGMTRTHTLEQDQSGYAIFLLVVAASCASLVAIGFVAGGIKDLDFWARAGHLSLTIGALLSSWLLIQTVFAFHYARRYYGAPRGTGTKEPSLKFPGDRAPDYMDFAYFSFVVGMTSQVSDVAITSRAMRRLTMVHGILAFVFNVAVLALSINIIAGAI